MISSSADRAALMALVDAWDPVGSVDLPDSVATALDGDPVFRAWFDKRFPPWHEATSRAEPARRSGPVAAMVVLGSLFTLATAASTLVIATGAWWFLQKDVTIGPKEEGVYFEDYARVDREELEASGLMDGLEEPFNAFVMVYNAKAAKDDSLLNDSKRWDKVFYEHVAASVYQHVQWKRTFRRLDEIKDDYATVTQILHEMDMPEVFAGIPYRESAYLPDIQSNACAKGWWQFMPETANRLGLRVKSCHFNDAEGTWEPGNDVLPPPNLFKNAKYINASGRCRITKCDVDDRTDLDKSTRAALETFKEPMEDPVLAASGSMVQITILSHNAGYDDARFGHAKKSNLLPAYKSYVKQAGNGAGPDFYGSMIKCGDPDDQPRPEVGRDGIPLTTNAPPSDNYCGSLLHAETQHYAYPIVARHFLAVCYYGKNYEDMKGFEDFAKWNSGSHYCTNFAIPSPAEVN